MTVSVVIPTYNRREQVARAIDSVLAQTVPVEEIIVVDDGSRDGTGEAIRSRYGSLVRLFVQENGGAATARNRALCEAKGGWIAFLDSDDVWLPAKIERQLLALSSLGDGFGVCFTDNAFGNNPAMNRTIFEEVGFKSSTPFGALDDPAACILAEREPFFTSSLLVRRSLIQEVGGFDKALVPREDSDLFFRLSFRTGFCFVAEPLVCVDRDPSRSVGLVELYATRDNRKYDMLARLNTKWLSMPQVVGRGYEHTVRERLRATYYSSAAAKLHGLRFGPALREIRRLKKMGESYPSVILNLLSRKIQRLRDGSPSNPKPRGEVRLLRFPPDVADATVREDADTRRN